MLVEYPRSLILDGDSLLSCPLLVRLIFTYILVLDRQIDSLLLHLLGLIEEGSASRW